MFGEVGNIIGQILGIFAVVSGFIAFQMKTPNKLLFVESITAAIFSAHYFFIGAFTAMALNFLGLIKTVVYYFRDKQGSKSLIWPILFTILTIVTGILTWEGWHSLLILLGLVVLAISLAIPNAQMVRFAMFIKSPLCLVYNIIVMSVGGIVYECAVLVSVVIATINYYKKDKKDDAKPV
jgi:hypothetical protein